MNNISLERLEQIEAERMAVMVTPEYQEWCKQLNVSRSVIEYGNDRATQMNEEYDFSKLKFRTPLFSL